MQNLIVIRQAMQALTSEINLSIYLYFRRTFSLISFHFHEQNGKCNMAAAWPGVGTKFSHLALSQLSAVESRITGGSAWSVRRQQLRASVSLLK